MDKGKSKNDLRAAGKKRLEEFRQKRQQKGSSTKPSSTSALEILTGSEQNVGKNEVSRRDSLLNEDALASSQNDGEVQAVVDHAHAGALEERHEIDVVFDASSGSSVTSPNQTLKVGGDHLTPETSEQSGESLRELGSSNGNLEDEDREAVYTVLWENDGIEHSQRSEDWQEGVFDDGSKFDERGRHHENDSSFWEDSESYRSEGNEKGSSALRKFGGNSIDAAGKFRSSEASQVDATRSNSFSESELGQELQSVKRLLQSRDLELIQATSKLEAATRVISQHEEEAKNYIQQNEQLKNELLNCREDLGMLKSNVRLSEEKVVGLKNELQDVVDSFNGVAVERDSQIEGVTPSMNDLVTEVKTLAEVIVELAHSRETELRSGNERAVAALLLEANSSKEVLAKLEQEVRDSRKAAEDIRWLSETSPPQSSLLDWVTWLVEILQTEHRKSEHDFRVIESMKATADEKALEVQLLREKIDSISTELFNQRSEKEAVAEDLRMRDLDLEAERDKLRGLAARILVLEAEVESARSLCRIENALVGVDEIVGDFGFQGRPSSTSSPTEWISWLLEVFREVSRQLRTSRAACDALSLEVEAAKSSHSSLFEEHVSQKNGYETLQIKHKDMREMFAAERDSLRSEIQVLRDSSLAVSRREFEFSEASEALTNLQETVALKDRELFELRDKMDALLRRSAEQDSSVQSLSEELERLRSEFTEVSAERTFLQSELLRAEADALHNERLKDELLKCREDLGMLKSNVRLSEEKVVGLKNELQDVVDSFNGVAVERDSQIEGVTPSMNDLVTEVKTLAEVIVELAHSRETELRSGNERAVAALLLEANSSKEVLAKLEQEVRDSRKAAEDIRWLSETSPPQSSLLDWVTWLVEILQTEHRKSEHDFRVIESMKATADEKALEVQLLREKIDSISTELFNQRSEKEAVAEDLRMRDLDLEAERDKLRGLAARILVLEAEVESARSLCRIENALVGVDEIVGDFGFQGRPSSTSSPTEWISWLLEVFREVSRQLRTSRAACDALSLEVEAAKSSHSSLFEEHVSQKNGYETLQIKHKDMREMFAAERDSLRSEIQVLRDSSLAVSRREFEFSEASEALTNLQETVALKDRELFELRDKMDALLRRSAEQDSSVQSLSEELERLRSEFTEVSAERTFLQSELLRAEADALHNERLKDELLKCREDLGMLKSNVRLSEEKVVGLKNELQDVVDSFNGVAVERDSQIEGVTPSMNDLVTEVKTLAEVIVELAHSRETELRSGNERAVAALLLEANSSKEVLAKLEQEVRDSRKAAEDIRWLSETSPPQSSLLDWVTWLVEILQTEHRKSEHDFRVIESMKATADEKALEVQLLREKIDSISTELFNQRSEKEAVAEDLRMRDLDLEAERDKLRGLAARILVLEAEVESARSLCRIENALVGVDEIVGDFGFQGRPSSTSSPTEWISWLLEVFREVSRQLRTSRAACDALSLEVEAAKSSHSSLFEEHVSQKNGYETLQIKHKDMREMFAAERDSLRSEIQVLRDSSLAVSRREFEFSEASEALTNLQETVALKDRELFELRDKMDALLRRSAEQDSSVQSLSEELERLRSEFTEVSAERTFLQSELLRAEADALHNERLKDELLKCREDLGMLKSNVRLSEEKVVGLKNELQDVVDSFNGVAVERDSQIEGVTPSMNDLVTEVKTLAEVIVELAHSRETELRSGNERAVAALLLEANSSKEVLAKLEQEVRDSRKAAEDIRWLSETSPPQSSLLDWVTWLVEILQTEHRKSEHDFRVIESMKATADEKALEVQLLREKIDSISTELFNQRSEKEAVAEDLRMRDLDLEAERDKLRGLAARILVLEAEVESARSLCRIENALVGVDEIVGDFGFQGRPSSTSSPTEWISWLLEVFREVSRQLRTSRAACDALSLEVEEAKSSHSSLFEEHVSQKNGYETLQIKHKDMREMFAAERDSLRSEIQVLRDSSLAVSRRELEFSEASEALTNLQETVALKDRELFELRDKMDALLRRSAEQDSSIQSLIEERERLSSQLMEVNAERSLLLSELAQGAMVRSTLQTDVDQLEQKLVSVREKLNLAIVKGKGLVKQRDALKKCLAEEGARLETMVSSHASEISSRDSLLREMRDQAESIGNRVQELQAEISSSLEKASACQQRMETERQRLEIVFSGVEFSEDLLPRDPVEKVKWLVSALEGTRMTSKLLEVEVASSRNDLESLKGVLRDTDKRLESVTVESLRAQERASIAVKKVEETEAKAALDIALYRDKVGDLTGALNQSDLRQQAAWSRVEECEKTLENQQNTIIASEAAHSKVVSKLSFTRNKLNLLVRDSQELVRECESLHKSLQERDIEIVELHREADKLKNVIDIEQSQRLDAGSKTSLQLALLQEELASANEKSAATVKDLQERQEAFHCVLKEKDSSLEGVRTKIEDILLQTENVLCMDHNIVHQNKVDDGVSEVDDGIDVNSMNGSVYFTSAFATLEQRFNNLFTEAHLYRSNSDEKEAEIHKLKEELHNTSVERTALQEGVSAITMEVERLRSEVNSKGVPVERNTLVESEIEELGTRSTWAGVGNPITPHVRGPRRHSQADIAIDMDDENSSNMLSDMNDKEHGFSALTNSRLVPKATRILADRLDGLWFVGGRILTRQPSARLGLAVYWIFIHVYMVMTFSRGIW